MNIFVTDPSPLVSARELADQHVVKMATETAQILGTVARLAGADDPVLARVTHPRHPSTVWTASSRHAATWLLAHGRALCAEYTARYGRVHGVLPRIEAAAGYLDRLPDVPMPPFALVMDDVHKGADPHAAYRACLRAKYAAWADLGRPARYTRRAPPEWLVGVSVRV